MLSSITIGLKAQEVEKTSQSDYSKGWAIGLRGSTIGPGVEIIKAFSPRFAVRAGWNALTYSDKLDIDDITATLDFDLEVGGPSLMVDFYPVKWMHLTTGVLFNNFSASGILTPEKTYKFGQITISPEKVGTVALDVEPGTNVSPYIGLGFGRSISLKRRLAFNLELGAFYHGNPKASLEATGMLAPSASEAQVNQLNENLKDYAFYPFVSFQLSYTFLKK
ncbi:hypothetical protein EMN47_09980 [Prolixibacteraceae bacterium JC049]|nr:hypothetical protein [Prolixibacteraceae bacterium JC049]